MTYGHLQADCLYAGISSGPNARYRVLEAFTFTLYHSLTRPNALTTMRLNTSVAVQINHCPSYLAVGLTEQRTDAGADAPANELSKHEVYGRLVESRVAAARPDLDRRLGREVNALWKLEHRQRPAADLLLYEVVLS